jgi:hypothetical protein
MFEEYLQDAHSFLALAVKFAQEHQDRDARRCYRASVFYAAGAIEAFVNYLAESFANAGSLTEHEIAFLNDKALIFSAQKGLKERTEFHRLDDKIRVLLGRFNSAFDFGGRTWREFNELKGLRNKLVHPRRSDDETPLAEYQRAVTAGLVAVISMMNQVSTDVFRRPLRKQLLDLIPE